MHLLHLPLARMKRPEMLDLQSSYNRIAQAYVEHLFHELEHKPLDRALLNRFAEQVRGLGPVCDMGCGPGHIAQYLHGRGVDVCGVDLSPGMVEQARRLNPAIPFTQGDMLSLNAADESWGGIVAFYSLIHLPRSTVVLALRELKRVLRSEGVLFLAFHIGQETLHRDELWGEEVSLDFLLFQPDEMKDYLTSAGFEIEDVIERPPYAEVEYQSSRAYIFARKPKSQSR